MVTQTPATVKRNPLASRWAAAALVLLTATPAFGDDDGVKIEKAEPTVEYKHFDPAHPPDPPPPIAPGEAAVCVYNYGVDVDSRYSYTPAPAGKEPVKLGVKIERVTLKLTLTITIWLPKTASKALAAHEEGHRTIAETFYKTADNAARALATKWVGQTVPGEGKDPQSAGQTAVEKVNQSLCDDYLTALNTPCAKSQMAFDQLTDHGRKDRPTAKEAVELALKEGRGGK